MNQVNKNILIITDSHLYQRVGAAYSRISCYKKALGDSCEFYSLDLNQFYISNRTTGFNRCDNSSLNFLNIQDKTDSYLYRNFINLFDFLRPSKLVKFVNQRFNKKNTIILLYTHNFLLFIITIIYLKFLYGYRVIIEKNELDTGKQLNVPLPKGYYLLLFIFLFPVKLLFAFLIDLSAFLGSAIIVISSGLFKIYRFHPNIYKIPVVVDFQKFEQSTNKPNPLVKFVYMGTFTKKKDSIFLMFKAIKEIKEIILNEAEFYFIGNGTRTIKQQLEKYIRHHSLDQLIKIGKPIPYASVPQELRKYDVALLLRETNIQTRYGFSTKLGEYLAAGLPVLTSNVSDNMLYLRDEVDSFLVSELSLEQVKLKLGYILQNRQQLIRMKIEARETAKKYFDIENHAISLREIFA
ncbi:MAG: glycosyltransferase [Candidatus Atribacteria bacterium]|nr:glycosyltransferase [Candidatus Atribacteria bacterium]